MDDVAILSELSPVVGDLLERHLRTSKDWLPHEYVPWSRGRDYRPDEEWNPDDHPLPDAVRSSLFVNLLTEDNLPHYFHQIRSLYPGEAWAEWANRWVAEEDRHAQVMRDWILVTRAIDPAELERARMAQLTGGQVPAPDKVLEGLVYVALQELATRLAHRNTGLLLEDEAGQAIMKRIATDENFHHLFYRDLCSAALELDPDGFMLALETQVLGFEMPGTGIAGFDQHAKVIAAAGIYDLEQHHDRILAPVLRQQWGVFEVTGLSDEAEQARDRVAKHLDRLERVAAATRRRRERHAEQAAATPVG